MQPADYESLLAANYQAVLDQVRAACEKANRSPADVQLVAVTKTVVPEIAKALVRLGAADLGENRLPSFDKKLESFGEDPAAPAARWHFIGQLQRNKVRRVVERAKVIHSVTSVKLLQAIGRIAGELACKPGVYLQVKHAALHGEEAKAGLTPDELPATVELAAQLAEEGKLELLGLMAMGPLQAELSAAQKAAAAAAVFSDHAALAASLSPTLFHQNNVRLSMGMSGDLEQAVAAGATCVRIGSALFRGLPDTYRIAPPLRMGIQAQLGTGGTL